MFLTSAKEYIIKYKSLKDSGIFFATLLKLGFSVYVLCIMYCSTIWHFCGARNSEKLELLNKFILRIILDDKASTHEMILESLGLVSLRERRFLDMLIIVHKSFQAATPAYISALLRSRINIYRLRDKNKLQLPRVNTASYGKHSFKFLARTATSTTYFRNNINPLLNLDVCKLA